VITALAILASIVVFCVAVLSPGAGTAIQQRAALILVRLHRSAHTKPSALKWLIRCVSNLFHFVVHKSAAAGKKSRWKLPF